MGDKEKKIFFYWFSVIIIYTLAVMLFVVAFIVK